MESNKILGADILDILFEGRNKEYGAYELRKTYNKRLGRAMAVMSSLILLLFMSGFVGKHTTKKVVKLEGPDVVIGPPPPVDPPPPPMPPKPELPKVAEKIFTPPKIVPNDQVPDNEKPPVQDDLVDVKIGTVNQEGTPDVGIAAAPITDGGKGITEAPKKEDDDGSGFIKIEKESEYPGGAGAWLRYLNKNLRTPDDAINNEVSGTVVVKFMVDPNGNISDVEAISGPDHGGLREEAVRVIKRSGKWTPALQNGRYVRSYKQQPITFVLENQ